MQSVAVFRDGGRDIFVSHRRLPDGDRSVDQKGAVEDIGTLLKQSVVSPTSGLE